MNIKANEVRNTATGECDKVCVLSKWAGSLICPLLYKVMSSRGKLTANYVLQSKCFKLHCIVPTYAQS